jgi:hypothetical protein
MGPVINVDKKGFDWLVKIALFTVDFIGLRFRFPFLLFFFVFIFLISFRALCTDSYLISRACQFCSRGS